ncbi:MAG: DUF2299 family protein [Candidatus Poseidoniaceae archaeon]|nr:hypothetical protein [Euryarchaeota archaeon]MCH1527784.1 DUF2299 family protein [Candidatus Poseidoniaceae archaeon]
MSPEDAEMQVRSWLASERIEIREQEDPRAHLHLLVKYPQGKNGHMFAVIIPKERDLLAISSMTRVDEGQQQSMKNMMKDDEEEWKSWMHECRMQLISSGVDWGIHLGHSGKERTGPLQAFNVSEPVWFDGLTKNEMMQNLRRLWLAKLGIIHEIKFAFGTGTGKPGPVDDWQNRKDSKQRVGRPAASQPKEIHTDDSMSFGEGFDPSDWI